MSTLPIGKIELIAWYYIRNNYEDATQERNVPAALKYLIRNFSSKVFNSKILSIKQDLDLRYCSVDNEKLYRN